MDDLLSEFLTETNESIETLDQEVVRLEQNPEDPELLGSIFRLMHTVKGTCGFLGLPRLEAVAHSGENVLGKLRDKELKTSPEAVSMILESLDRIRLILNVLENTEAEPEGDDQDLIVRLNHFAEGGDAAVAPQEAEAAEPAMEEPVGSDEMAPAANEDEGMAPADEPALEEAQDEIEAPELAASELVTPEPAQPKEEKPTPPAKSEALMKSPCAAKQVDEGNKENSVANQSLRVSVEVLENLMTMVSELVLTRNQLLQILRTQKDSDFTGPLQQLNHVVSELQDGVMQTRMQPIGNAWAKLPRIVRDLSLELGKKIDLVMKGAETELDRQVLDLIKDPLTHMVRNSGDHGLETPQDRVAAGKNETGTILLNAYHEGGHIIIQISDDGRGLPVDKIKEKAIKSGLANEAELETMTDQQIQQFIFKAGFSTAATVTSVSGRGVGMDVVRTNIEKIGGTIELTSVEGRGSKFTIKIPLTLAIVSALIVESGGERFAIPQLSVIELVRASANSEHTIEAIKDTPVLRLRNRLLPLVNLSELLRLAPDPSEADIAALAAAKAEEAAAEAAGEAKKAKPKGADGFIVVAQVGTYNFGIIVDRVFDTEEIVVKPVAPILRHLALFSGNTILGDGSVVMILDPNGIAAATGEIGLAEGGADGEGEHKMRTGQERVAMLIFRVDGTSPRAVPLALVARLEEVDGKEVEKSNGRYVVQYRGQLMPLVLPESRQSIESEDKLSVLVFSDRERTMGLVVDEIVDIVEDDMEIELADSRPGFMGSAVIDGKATDIIDTGYFLNQAFPDWFNSAGATEEGGHNRILLVDDSSFFRNLLAPLLKTSGYDVITADSAEEALQMCAAGESFDLIVSDIEMPGMDGFAFAQTVKTETRWATTPMVALSSHTGPKALARGHEVGFSDYVAKLDRDGLLQTINHTLSEMRGAA